MSRRKLFTQTGEAFTVNCYMPACLVIAESPSLMNKLAPEIHVGYTLDW